MLIKSKDQLRKEYIQIRNTILDKDKKSHNIFLKIIKSKDYNRANVIALYKSIKSEVNTDELINYTLKIKKIVVLPRIVNGNIEFYQIFGLNENFETSNLGIEEPILNSKHYFPKDKIDFIIVPGLCFDKEGNRLGFGKGYYDKYLAYINLKTTAICYDEQILQEDKIPISNLDVKIDNIITDKKIYKKSR